MSVLKQHLSIALLLAFALATTALTNGCSMSESDPTQQTIPTDSNQWQKKLGDTFEQLPESDRKLLSRYMLRMKLSDAYEDLTNELAPTNTVARLLGYAAGIGSDPREDAYVVREVNPDWLYEYGKRATLDMSQAHHWQHLLTIYSVLEIDLCIWDAGYLQVLIKDSDLTTLNFGRIYMAVESS